MYIGSLGDVSNRQDWLLEASVTDPETGDAVDLSAATIVFEVRDRSRCIILSATNGNGKITVPELGSFQVTFSVDDMRKLCPGSYAVGCTVEVNDVTSPLIAASSVSVVDGVVS